MIVIVAFVLLWCFFAVVFACIFLPAAFRSLPKDAVERDAQKVDR